MSLRDLNYKVVYVSGLDNLVKDFYIPSLAESNLYRRRTGYFNSRALAMAARGISGLLRKNGKMQLLCSVELDKEDEEVLKDPQGYVQNIEKNVLEQLNSPYDELEKKRFGLLAELITRNALEIRICLKYGGIYHEKTGIFSDDIGNYIVFNGSGNETPGGWLRNQENFNVFTSWDDAKFADEHINIFNMHWEGEFPGLDTYPISKDVLDRIAKFRDYYKEGFDEPIDPTYLELVKKDQIEWKWTPELAFIFEAPRLWNHTDFAYGETAVTPFEHQDYIASNALKHWPPRYILCDEVGLGKTIEAGLIIHGFIASRNLNRLLILAPKNALIQWQQELYTKFRLKLWRLDGNYVIGPKLHPNQEPEKERVNPHNPFSTKEMMLVSSQLIRLEGRQKQLLDRHYDMVVLDEAHHARARYDRDVRVPNKLLKILKQLRYQTQSILLLTATPIQIDRRELWDLLNVLELPGKWQDPEKFNSFIELMDREPIDWSFLIEMVKDSMIDIESDPEIRDNIKDQFPDVNIYKLNQILKEKNVHEAISLNDDEKNALKLLIFKNTPIRKTVFRNSRELLKKYQEEGKFSGKIAKREPEKISITLQGLKDDKNSEAGLYDRIETYVKEYYGKYKSIRKGLGFIMVTYRKRLTSSLAAIKISLRRRHDKLKNALENNDFSELFTGLEEDEAYDISDIEDIDSSEEDINDVLRDMVAYKRLIQIIKEEYDYLDRFIRDLENLNTDSKLEHFREKLKDITGQGIPQTIIFSQFKDTVNYLCNTFAPLYGDRVGTYTGDGGEYYIGGKWLTCSKQELQEKFRNPDDKLSILFCTDAASESLNLQTCSVMFNYDIPWNPMRIEQRIGRVDRIGQESPIVNIYTYSYKDTVEDKAFDRCLERIGYFQSTLGYIQPILQATQQAIKEATLEVGTNEEEDVLDKYFDSVAEFEEDTRIDYLVNKYEPQLEKLEDKVPVSQQDLESILSKNLEQFGWSKKNDIWIKNEDRITFDVKAFDESGEEAKLITPRSPIASLFGQLPNFPQILKSKNHEIHKIEAEGYTGFLVKDENGFKLAEKLNDLNGMKQGRTFKTIDEGQKALENKIKLRKKEKLKTLEKLWNNRYDSWKIRLKMYLEKIFEWVKENDIQPGDIESFGEDQIIGHWRKYLADSTRKELKKLAEIIEYQPDLHLDTKRKRKGPGTRSPRSADEEKLFVQELNMINEELERVKGGMVS